jgi:glycosyltransferase involved in cell wall biosynthesis
VRLSLCMATMNRGAVIGETFASIAAQGELSAMELIVIDGSADDATERALAAWQDRLPPVRYERRAPQGFDRDYCAAVAAASGEYCWLMADDDPIRPGAVAAIREAMAGEPDFVVINGEVRGPDLQEQLVVSGVPLAEDRVFRVGEDDALAAATLAFLSYVGAVVVRRSLWQARRPEEYWGTDFVHVGMLLQRPIERSVVVLARPLVTLRFGVALWMKRAFEIWMLQWPKLVWSFPQISAATKENVTPREPWRRMQQLLLERAKGHYGRPQYRQWISGPALGRGYRLAAWMIALMPIPVAARAARWYFKRSGRYEGVLAWEIQTMIERGGR